MKKLVLEELSGGRQSSNVCIKANTCYVALARIFHGFLVVSQNDVGKKFSLDKYSNGAIFLFAVEAFTGFPQRAWYQQTDQKLKMI